MKRSFVKPVLMLFSLFFCGLQLYPQAANPPDTLENLLKVYKAAAPGERVDQFSNPGVYVTFLLNTQAMHEAEVNRIDKQTGASSTAGTSTSAVTKGSVPWLFSVALEHGALTQSVDGNVITFKGNVANTIKAINAKDYLKAFTLGEDNLFIRNITRTSFGISFNSSGGNASPNFSTNTFSSANVHIDLFNHRDPRDKKWTSTWMHLGSNALQNVANSRGAFIRLVQSHTTEFSAWQSRTRNTLSNLGDKTTDEQITSVLQQIGNDLASTFSGFPDIQEKAKQTNDALTEYASQKKDVLARINKDPILSVEYTYTNQSSTSLPTSTTQTLAVGTAPPNLSNINVILSGSLGGNSQGTLNASTTLFNTTPAGSKIGTVRDYRVAGQLDYPIEIHNLGNSSLSFSFLFLSLLEEPLGQQVLVNNVPISTKGNINVLQAKWTIPMGDGGFKVPISVTRSNRTELINEKDVRGTIGISYDFDGLFSKLTAK